MTDLEGTARILIARKRHHSAIRETLANLYLFHKDLSPERAEELADAVVKEIRSSLHVASSDKRRFLRTHLTGVKMGEQGVGSRGSGDEFVHRLIAEICQSQKTGIELAPIDQDDAGAVAISSGRSMDSFKDQLTLVSAIDGMHSRLSEYGFVAGFHCTRAALRDILVKGASPTALMVDIHLGDDADVAKLLDFMGGCQAVAELSKVPIVAGSTLRIGGDMVLGDRMTGGVAAVGFSSKPLFARKAVQEGDKIFMTSGSGGGTICTTAIFAGYENVVEETLNTDFVEASRLLISEGLRSYIHAATDVTNGGVRGDATEISRATKLGLVFNREAVIAVINPKVRNMLDDLQIDPLGVSIDSLMLFLDEEGSKKAIQRFRESNISLYEVGKVISSPEGVFESKEGSLLPLDRQFREAAYTPLKKAIGTKKPRNEVEMQRKLIESQKAVKKKIANVISLIQGRKNNAMG
ncbi:MAG: AIR synthase-related protein [Candidatus Heimdallarchaeota archaeon]